ncbi:class F sortase [Streptomyces sp. TRM 70361]|uniref:class F sortase n=1 Tax=Streptomyces sp. TRM 70361 TaxID=3116553 RepID=UPI002E7B3BCE|nr:class F sortase [Streptomyces sp. TRM 70361]MEE1938457.1 class F sortase [Streptomyces sp. TRM 70361]
MRTSGTARAALAAVAAAVLGMLGWALWPPGTAAPEGFGDRPRAQAPAAGPSAGPAARTRPGTADQKDSGAAAEPVRIRVPRVGLTARVGPVGVEEDGTVEVPADAGSAGWYRYGPPPGADAGSAVLVGHVDDRTGELGAFAKLYGVRSGDAVTVARRGAPAVRYEVTARETVAKDRLPAEVFRRTGQPVLTLVTCAPPYDRERGGYQRNLVVYAVPARD